MRTKSIRGCGQMRGNGAVLGVTRMSKVSKEEGEPLSRLRDCEGTEVLCGPPWILQQES